MDALRRSHGRHARAAGRLYGVVPAISRQARRHAWQMDRRKLSSARHDDAGSHFRRAGAAISRAAGEALSRRRIPYRAPRRGRRKRHRRHRRDRRARPSHPARADRQGEEPEMGAGADHRHRDADRAGRAAAARGADLDARHPRPANERACVPQHDRAGAQLPKECCATRPRPNGSNGASRSSRARPSSSSAWACWPSISPSAASCSA